MSAIVQARTPPSDTAPLPMRPVPHETVDRDWPPLFWAGCHGGAGVSTLRGLTGLGVDLGVGWPGVDQSLRRPPVVLVCRGSASGLWAATGAAEQWRRRTAELRVDLLGLVVVAASPRKPPRIVVERVRLLTGWLPKVWRIGWVETLLAADDPRDVGTPPDVAALRQALLKTRK